MWEYATEGRLVFNLTEQQLHVNLILMQLIQHLTASASCASEALRTGSCYVQTLVQLLVVLQELLVLSSQLLGGDLRLLLLAHLELLPLLLHQLQALLLLEFFLPLQLLLGVHSHSDQSLLVKLVHELTCWSLEFESQAVWWRGQAFQSWQRDLAPQSRLCWAGCRLGLGSRSCKWLWT